ncbi:hypothetical protein C8K30_101977 [Promicromonospora sp. AC04]|nr:hypothetical protein C8K30_101977 [Promicromonospora sp. AC04]
MFVEGRSITEASQKAIREKLDTDVASAIETNGYAQLIFDDYGRAIRRSQSGTLHSMLYRLLVDSATARDTGALLIARPSDMLDLNFAGSPLISRAQTVVLPALAEADASELGFQLAELQDLAGESTWLARRLMSAGPRQGRVGVVEHLNFDRRRIVESLPPGAVEVLAGAGTGLPVDSISREALMCLGAFDADDAFEPATLVSESKFLDEVRLQNPGWPGSLAESVHRFADLLVGAENAFWVDRYLLAEPSRVREFLDLLQPSTTARLRLLVSDDRERANFPGSISSVLDGVQNVEVRFMHRLDRKPLHDRHLVLPALRSGYVLPTARVILGIDDPGTALAVPMPAVDYTAYWRRATPVFPAANYQGAV